MPSRFLALLAALCVAVAPTAAQERKRVERAADLPRFNYPVAGDLERLVHDDAAFAAFAGNLRRDIDSVLATHDIADQATLRGLLGTLLQLDFIAGRHDEALARTAQIRALQEKPADKLLSGMQTRAMIAARRQVGDARSEAYRREVGRRIAEELDAMPAEVIQNDIRRAKAGSELMGEALILGRLRDQLQPVVARNGALSSDLAPAIVRAKHTLDHMLPLKATLIDTYAAYLARHKVDKPDIWAARDVALPAGRGHAPVRIAVWDSGVDVALFQDQLARDATGKPALVAFDRYGEPSTAALYPVPEQMQQKLPTMQSRTKGLSDLQSDIDSPESAEVKRYLSGLTPDQYKAAVEELGLAGTYAHGTHVAGIALAGNPYARLVIGRIEFQYTLQPDPCPSPPLVDKMAANYRTFVDYFRAQRAQVVNMSWGGSVRGYEAHLERCGIGKTPDERKAIARDYFERGRVALTEAMAGAPGILFVASAGNSNNDASFIESIPSGIRLPNLITVGAVDKAGDEAAFTSYGSTVAVHANGYQVESTVPGGARVALSGTSMSSPQVSNLAAKMLAVNPKLTPPELIAIIRDTAEKTADGRRVLIHPASAVQAAATRHGG